MTAHLQLCINRVIDKDTSGLLIVAKTTPRTGTLAEQIKAHSHPREYRAVGVRKIREDGTVDAPIARHPQDRKHLAGPKHAEREKCRDALFCHKILRDLRSCAMRL